MLRSRLIWRTFATLAAVAALTAIFTSSASAAIAVYPCIQPLATTNSTLYGTCPSPTPTRTRSFISADYKGWAYVFGRADCPAGAQCFAAGEPTIAAWRWSNGAWSRSSFNRNEQVYAWPYGGGWQWAWTQRTGWLAIQTSRLYTWQLNPLEAAAN